MAFIKLNRDGNSAEKMMAERPTAYLLLSLIAMRAKRSDNHPNKKLKLNQAYIGDKSYCGNNDNIYRSDKKYLEKHGYCRFEGTNQGTVATLLQNDIFDINADLERPQAHERNHEQNNEPATSKRQSKKAKSHEQSTNQVTSEITTNKECFTRNILTAVSDSKIEVKNMSEVLAERFSAGEIKGRKVYHSWQAEAIRYAEALKIDLDGHIKNDSGRKYPLDKNWFRIFEEAEEKGKMGRIEQAYSFFADMESWDDFSNEKKFSYVMAVYHHGVDRFRDRYRGSV
jgi:hypothetical protein